MHVKNWKINYKISYIYKLAILLYFNFVVYIYRIETLGLGSRAGKIRSLGALLCLGGALTIALYKGKSFHFTHYHEPLSIQNTKQNMTRGTLFLVASVLSYGIWFILQVINCIRHYSYIYLLIKFKIIISR